MGGYIGLTNSGEFSGKRPTRSCSFICRAWANLAIDHFASGSLLPVFSVNRRYFFTIGLRWIKPVTAALLRITKPRAVRHALSSVAICASPIPCFDKLYTIWACGVKSKNQLFSTSVMNGFGLSLPMMMLVVEILQNFSRFFAGAVRYGQCIHDWR